MAPKIKKWRHGLAAMQSYLEGQGDLALSKWVNHRCDRYTY